MSNKTNLIFLITLITISYLDCSRLRSSSTTTQTPQTVLDIHYESLCPFSQEFINGTLREFLSNPNLRKLAKINFHPYGKTTDQSNGTEFKFTCQHGPNECFGNKVQLCGLKKLDQENGINFVICMETNIPKVNDNISAALKSCVIPENLYADILKCANGVEGNTLYHQETSIVPKLDHVPAIVVNGQFDEYAEEDIRNSVKNYICRQGENSRLPECAPSSVLVDYNQNIIG